METIEKPLRAAADTPEDRDFAVGQVRSRGESSQVPEDCLERAVTGEADFPTPRLAGIDDAIARAQAYEAAGVDALFLIGIKTPAS